MHVHHPLVIAALTVTELMTSDDRFGAETI